MLNAIRNTAEAIARSAGAILREYASRPDLPIDYKDTAINVVTAADKAAESYIIASIQSVYPDHSIASEEGGGDSLPAENAPFRWYVDPLDGTANFAHGYPFYAVNLSVVDEAGEPVIGVTYDPTRDECFAVVRGQGATLNGRPIHVSPTSSLLRALLTTGFAYDAHTAADNNTAAWSALTRRAQSLRRDGAASLDFAYVACGRVDGYWESKLQPWDMMAGVLMIREAGGRVTTYTGDAAGLYSGQKVLCSNGLIHQEMVDVLAEVEAGLAS